MSKRRKNHSPEFKAKVALAAISGDQTATELASRYGINASLITKWKKQLIEHSCEVFSSSNGVAPDSENEIKSLHSKIGQLAMENDFLAKALGR